MIPTILFITLFAEGENYISYSHLRRIETTIIDIGRDLGHFNTPEEEEAARIICQELLLRFYHNQNLPHRMNMLQTFNID